MSAVVALVLAMFISNLSSDKIAHVHIYATSVLCVIFWIKSNIKMSNFLTVLKAPNVSVTHWLSWLIPPFFLMKGLVSLVPL